MLARHRREVSVGIAIAVLWVVVGFGAPEYFTRENLTDLLMANMPVLIVALGMTLVIVAGQIDISVGSVFAVCSVASGLFAKAGLAMPFTIAGSLLLGGRIGIDQRRLGRLCSNPFDCGDTGVHGGPSRRSAMEYARRLGAGSSPKFSVVRVFVGGLAGSHTDCGSGGCSAAWRGLREISRLGERCTRPGPVRRPRCWRESILRW